MSAPEVIAAGGVYLPVFLAFLAVAGLIFAVLARILSRLRLYRWFWHPALAAAAVFVLLLSVLLLAFGPG